MSGIVLSFGYELSSWKSDWLAGCYGSLRNAVACAKGYSGKCFFLFFLFLFFISMRRKTPTYWIQTNTDKAKGLKQLYMRSKAEHISRKSFLWSSFVGRGGGTQELFRSLARSYRFTGSRGMAVCMLSNPIWLLSMSKTFMTLRLPDVMVTLSWNIW